MKKIGTYVLARGMAVLLAAAAVGGGTVYAGSVLTKNGLLSGDEAAEFAVMDAGVEKEETSGMKTSLEREDGQYVYDIRFYVGSAKYEYEIRAEDGVILEKEIENRSRKKDSTVSETDTDIGSRNDPANKEADAPELTAAAEQSDPKEAAAAEQYSAEQTIAAEQSDPEQAAAAEQSDPKEAAAAEQDAPEQAVTTKQEAAETPAAQNDRNAEQGNTDPLTDESAQTVSRYISVDQAKQIALEDAGLSESEVRFSTAKFEDDDDDGEEYEIEFYYGKYEYEYDIDAVTGKILESSVEVDDD